MNLESIVKGITEVYNDSEVKVQQIIKLSWWDENNHTENVIADVMGISETRKKSYIKTCRKSSRIGMTYDKATVKAYILNYHKIQDNRVSCDEDVGIDDFFNVNDQAETHEIDNNNVEESIFYNEIETVIERVATEKEHNLFLLLCNGVSFEKIGNIFGVKAPRVKQMLNELLDKIAY
ncbi:hypothetical protein [Staphylococcus cohnii]|uniref:hypothetical protein n=1 Tax=Staphylococcus cohnii TaxID=29382 RepID=UPI0030B8CA1B